MRADTILSLLSNFRAISLVPFFHCRCRSNEAMSLISTSVFQQTDYDLHRSKSVFDNSADQMPNQGYFPYAPLTAAYQAPAATAIPWSMRPPQKSRKRTYEEDPLDEGSQYGRSHQPFSTVKEESLWYAGPLAPLASSSYASTLAPAPTTGPSVYPSSGTVFLFLLPMSADSYWTFSR